jgi:hypothetical protein
MKLKKLIPKIFYADVRVGLNFFVTALGFNIVYSEAAGRHPLYIIERDDVKISLVEDAEFALKDRPEIRVETDDIDALYGLVAAANPELLHPGLHSVTLRPWGLKEFALLDGSGVCVIFQQ